MFESAELGHKIDKDTYDKEVPPLREALLTHSDYYMHLADLKSYLEADERLCQLYADSVGWARKAILNIANTGKFSSDRTIAEYAADIWNVKPCPVE